MPSETVRRRLNDPIYFSPEQSARSPQVQPTAPPPHVFQASPPLPPAENYNVINVTYRPPVVQQPREYVENLQNKPGQTQWRPPSAGYASARRNSNLVERERSAEYRASAVPREPHHNQDRGSKRGYHVRYRCDSENLENEPGQTQWHSPRPGYDSVKKPVERERSIEYRASAVSRKLHPKQDSRSKQGYHVRYRRDSENLKNSTHMSDTTVFKDLFQSARDLFSPHAFVSQPRKHRKPEQSRKVFADSGLERGYSQYGVYIKRTNPKDDRRRDDCECGWTRESGHTRGHKHYRVSDKGSLDAGSVLAFKV